MRFALPLLLLLASPAAAQDGGKIAWKGKGDDPVQGAYEAALRDAKPIVMFFSVEGNSACKELSSGAFSDPAVVDASSKLSCIFVECGNGKNSGLVVNLKIKQFPAIVYLDPSGIPLQQIFHRDAPSIANGMTELASLFNTLPRFPEDLDGALAAAKKEGLPLLIYFYDDSPATLAVNKSINDAELKPLRDRFGFARFPMRRGSEVCAKYEVDRAPTILVLDPRLPKPEERPLARIAVSRSPRELRRDLEDALAAFPGKPGDNAAVPSTLPLPAPKEKLSEDEIDRKFIKARVAVATDLLKRGKAKEAVDVLEDVIQTWPKHVETAEARKLLDQIRKK